MKLFYEQKRCHLQHNRDFEGIALVGKLDRAIVFGDDLTDNPDTPAMVFCIEFCCMELIFCNRNLRSLGIFNGNKEVASTIQYRYMYVSFIFPIYILCRYRLGCFYRIV